MKVNSKISLLNDSDYVQIGNSFYTIPFHNFDGVAFRNCLRFKINVNGCPGELADDRLYRVSARFNLVDDQLIFAGYFVTPEK